MSHPLLSPTARGIFLYHHSGGNYTHQCDSPLKTTNVPFSEKKRFSFEVYLQLHQMLQNLIKILLLFQVTKASVTQSDCNCYLDQTLSVQKILHVQQKKK